jgi:hypothetical protein
LALFWGANDCFIHTKYTIKYNICRLTFIIYKKILDSIRFSTVVVIVA